MAHVGKERRFQSVSLQGTVTGLSLIHILLYNLYPTVEDKTIQNDTMQYIREYLSRHFPGTKFEVVPEINNLYQTM